MEMESLSKLAAFDMKPKLLRSEDLLSALSFGENDISIADYDDDAGFRLLSDSRYSNISSKQAENKLLLEFEEEAYESSSIDTVIDCERLLRCHEGLSRYVDLLNKKNKSINNPSLSILPFSSFIGSINSPKLSSR